METALADPLFFFAADVRAFLDSLERAEKAAAPERSALHEQGRKLLERVQSLRASAGERASVVAASLDELRAEVARWFADAAPTEPGSLEAARAAVADKYERLITAIRAANLRASQAPPLVSLRPTNYARNVFHVGNGVLAASTYQWLLGRTGCTVVMLSILAVYFTLDLTRRRWPRFNDLLMNSVFRVIARPKERYAVPSATWFALGVLPVLLLTSQTTTQVAVLVLGFGDPAASLVGRRFGRIRLLGHKSLEGALAFIVASVLVVTPFLVFIRGLESGVAFAIAGVGALAGAVAEILSNDHLDDNFSVPVAVGLALGAWVG